MSNEARPFDVFISHSTKDVVMASAMKQRLQGRGIRCWKAPDDILPGESWPMAITRALANCRVMVLIWSGNSMSSHEVSKELTLAMRNNLTVIPFRIENIAPVGEWDYHLVNTHWMDAHDGVMEEHLDALVGYLLGILPDRIAPDENYLKKAPDEGVKKASASTSQAGIENKADFSAQRWILVAIALAVVVGCCLFFMLPREVARSTTMTPSVAHEEHQASLPQPGKVPVQDVSPLPGKLAAQGNEKIMFDVRSGYAAELSKMIRESQIESLSAVNGTGAFSSKIEQLKGEAAQQDKIAESSANSLQEFAQNEKNAVILAFQEREKEIQQAATDPKAAVKAAAALHAFRARAGIP